MRLKKAPSPGAAMSTPCFLSWSAGPSLPWRTSAQLGGYLKVMFGLGGAPLADGALGYYLTSYLPILCAGGPRLHPSGRKTVPQARLSGQRRSTGAAAHHGRPVGVHRLSGGRHLQSLPLFPFLRRRRLCQTSTASLIHRPVLPLHWRDAHWSALLLPDKSFSPLENRYLQQPPKLSLETARRRHLYGGCRGLCRRPYRWPGLLGGRQSLV